MEVECEVKLVNVTNGYPCNDIRSLFYAALRGDLEEQFKDDDKRLELSKLFDKNLDDLAQRAFRLGLENGKKEFK